MGKDFDVTILGGGLAGLTLAKQLISLHPNLSILVLEKRKHPIPDDAYHKVGESTVEIGAHYLSERVGLKKHLIDKQLPKMGLRFFFNNGKHSLADRVEVGPINFFSAAGFQVDRGPLENHLREELENLSVQFIHSTMIKNVQLNDDAPHQVQFLKDKQLETVSSKWVVDASGRMGILRKKLGLKKEIGHNVNAVWFRVNSEVHVDNWCDDPDWKMQIGKVQRRWLSTNHLLGKGYWIWIIPLANGSTSIGIVTDPRIHSLKLFKNFDMTMDWLTENEPLCASCIEPHREGVHDYKALKRLGYSSKQVFSKNRWAMTGEAAVFLDPFYSPGIDYIAMGNTMITSLINADIKNEPFEIYAEQYQNTFLMLFDNNLLTYEDQYGFFGNPRVMSLKYVWDYIFYWGVPALLYFNDKLTDPLFVGSLSQSFIKLRDLNQKMQTFFRDWDAVDHNAESHPVFVNQNKIELLTQLNAELKERLPDDELRTRFLRNVKILEDLAGEITTRVSQVRSEVQLPSDLNSKSFEQHLNGVFSALGM